MGSHQSKTGGSDHTGAYGIAQFPPTGMFSAQPSEPYKHSAVVSVASLPNSLANGSAEVFPTELPERPPKLSWVSLRKRKSSALLPLTRSPASSIPLSAPLSPQTPESTTFASKAGHGALSHQAQLPAAQSTAQQNRILNKINRKPSRLDGISNTLRPAASTPNLSIPNDGQPNYLQQQFLGNESVTGLPSPPSSPWDTEPHHSPSGDQSLDPLARRFAELTLPPFRSTLVSLPPSNSLTPTQHDPIHLVSEGNEMGVSRTTQRHSGRGTSLPYQTLQARREKTNHGQSSHVRSDRRIPRTQSDDIFYPELGLLPDRAAQEALDRELAIQLQREEDSFYSNPWHGNSVHRRPINRGTRDDPVDVDSNDEYDFDADAELERRLQQDFNVSNLQATLREDADALYARQIHNEEVTEMRRQASVPRTRNCVVCGEDVLVAEFPALVDCAHEPETCPKCYQGWIESELNSKRWDEIRCPGSECRVILKHYEVQQYATPEVYARFDQLSARSALSDDPDFRWCRARNCTSGQIHVSGEEGNIFRCVECGFKVCIVHEDTWHEGETCDEYDYRVSGRKEKDQKAQEEASAKALKKFTKKCPGKKCGWNIEKNDGCDHMTCSKCKHEFCWICLAPYAAIRATGNSAHNRNCTYHSSRIR
ncbi:hypothetical protein CC78DRAFT_528017 [Lojkania enalia]|uniref:RBR-type E3 ubiquitin transferase n=1 Tax=Lojkania enalia TaxID=147567 RepID=A0A9P4TS67_9PLEO|nr:hypothetical protein CC78DRAFT_528017 [Didymosphaeria enalia]